MAAGDQDETAVRETGRSDPSSDGSRGGTARGLLDEPVDALTPRYDLRGRLGRGGMGEVLEAFDRRLRREVAVKVLRVGDPEDEDVKRFLREAQVTAQLDHPHVPPVHDLGVGPDGSLFFTMKRLTGRTLSELVKQGELSLHQRLDVFLKVCDAVAYAHARGVIHRDIKPANVMVGAFREVYLLDWGLAKQVSEDDSLGAPTLDDDGEEELTAGGSVLGTPGYMSPEQARGERHLVDARSDVYALGVLLYVLLTGAGPFPGRGRAALEQVRAGRFDPPSARAPHVPRELEAVVLRAMAARQGDRYGTVEELRAEVQRFLEGQPLLTVPYTPRQRVSKWAMRNRRPLAVAGSALVLVGLLLVLVLATNLATVSAARDRAVDAEARSQLSLADSEVALARAIAELGRLEDALAALDRAEARYRSLGGAERKATLARSVLAQRWPPPEITWRHDGRLTAAAITPSGDRALLVADDAVRIYALPSGRTLFRATHPDAGPVTSVAFGEGRPLAVIEHGTHSVVIDLSTGAPVSPPIAHPPRSAGFGSYLVDEGRQVVLTSPAGGTWVHRVADGAPVGVPDEQAYVIAVSADGSRMAGYRVVGAMHRSADATIVWEVATGAPLVQLPQASAVAFSSDGRHLAYDLDGEVTLLDLETLEERWRAPDIPATRISFARGDRALVMVGADQRIVVLDAATGAPVGERRTITGISKSQGRVFVASHGERVLTLDGEVARLWSLGAGDDAPRVEASDRNLTAIDLSPDGLLAASAGWDGVVRLWEWRSRTLLRAVAASPAGTRDVAFSPDGALLLTADRDGVGRLVRTDTGAIVRELHLPDARLAMGARFVAGDAVVTYEGGRIVGFDPATGAERWRLQGSIDNVWGLAASPDGARLAVSSRARTHAVVEVWDLPARRLLWAGPRGEAGYRLAFSPDGRRLLVGTHEGQVQLYDVAGDGTPTVIGSRSEAIQAVGWSPDGTLLAIGGYDGQVDLYDAATHELLQSVALHGASIVDLAFAPDGTIVTASGDRSIGVLDPDRWVRLGPSSLVLDLDAEVPEPDGARWLELAEGAALRSNWHLALEALDRAAAAGVTVSETDRARALWALGRRDEARAELERALARGGGPTLRAWWSAR